MAAKLKMAGIESFDLYEQRDDLGGTWHANTYPGLHCDVASRYYQYTFAPNPDWSQVNASGREIWAYLNEVADHFGIREHTSFRTRVTEAEWVDGVWRLRCDDGREEEYDFIVTAAGGLVHTKKPDLEGLRDVRRRRVPLGRVGPLGRAGGQADRRDRHRLDGDADHPRARAGRRPLRALPAHAAVDLPGAQPPLHALGQVAVPPVPGAQPRRVPRLAAGLRGDVRTGGHRARPRSAWRSAPAAGCTCARCATPSCDAASRPTTSRCASAW